MNAAYLYARRRLLKSWKRRLRSRLPGVKTQDAHTNLLASSRIDWPSTRAFWREPPDDLRQREGPLPGRHGGTGRRVPGPLPRSRRPVRRRSAVKNVHGRADRRTRADAGRDVLGAVCRKAPDLLNRMEGWRLHGTSRIREPGGPPSSQNSGAESSRAPSSTASRPSGIHAREGIFVASGEGIVAGHSLGAEPPQRPPTLHNLLDVPVPPDLDGKVRTDLFYADYAEARPVRYSEEERRAHRPPPGNLSSEDADRIEERLRGLGYIE